MSKNWHDKTNYNNFSQRNQAEKVHSEHAKNDVLAGKRCTTTIIDEFANIDEEVKQSIKETHTSNDSLEEETQQSINETSTSNDSSETTTITQSKRVAIVVGCKKLNVRSQPKKQIPNIIGILTEGDEVRVQTIGDEWSNILTAEGLNGYVLRKFLKED